VEIRPLAHTRPDAGVRFVYNGNGVGCFECSIAVGDGEFQKKCLQTMGELRDIGRTVLFVSHNLAAVENLCSRAIWLDNGTLRDNGRPKDIIQEYMSTFGDARAGEVDLHHILARRGSGEARFSRIEFLTRERRRTRAIASGDSLVIRLHYRAESRIAKPVFGMQSTPISAPL
jgi:ABC-type glutathione transport system ATPase component